MGLSRSIDPVKELIGLDQLKNHLVLDSSDSSEDAKLRQIIRTATSEAENFTERAFITQTWEYTLDNLSRRRHRRRSELWFDGVRELPISEIHRGGAIREILIPRPPLQSVILSTFTFGDVEQVFDADKFFLDTTSSPGRLILKDSQIWPSDMRSRHAVRIQVVAGYGPNPDDVPDALLQAVLIFCGYLYETRGDSATGGCNLKAASSRGDGPTAPIVMALDPYVVRRLV